MSEWARDSFSVAAIQNKQKKKKKPREAQPKSAHRKFKRQQHQRGHAPGAAPPTVHPGCRRFCGAKVQRRDSAADAPQHVLRGRNDDAGCANRPQHRPQLPDPGVQGRRQPAGQPDEPAQHHARPAEPAGVRVATAFCTNRAYLSKLNSSYSY